MIKTKSVFVSYAESAGALQNTYRLAESIRTFGGRFCSSPVWVYIPQDVSIDDKNLLRKLKALDVEVRISHTPEEARWFFYGGKAYAAAEAEKAAAGTFEMLVWLDDDTIMLQEPDAFALSPETSFAYHPVMHNRSGSLFESAPDAFWSRIYKKLSLTDDLLFPMVTPVDEQKIRAYFHAGIMVTRPERGVLRRWAKDFELLYRDAAFTDMCRADVDKRIFLHQAALTGAVLSIIAPGEMLQLSERYNYPIFFERQYDTRKSYTSIEDVVTIRCVVSLKNMGAEWYHELAGPSEKVNWIRERLHRE
jgi:hypothetical protein